jgi:GcrA cell cycle regulator
MLNPLEPEGAMTATAAGWTEDRVGALKKLWLEGQSASQIAKALGGGVTRNAVIGKVHRLGLSGRAAPSQPVRTVFRPARPKPVQPAMAQPSAPRRIEAAEPRPVVQPVAVPDLPGTATVMTLGAHMCKWPIGDPSSREFSFCGRRASEGVYCVEHARVAYQPPMKGKKDGASELARSLRRYL